MSLRTRGIALIVLLLLVGGGGALALFSHIAQGIAWRLGTDFATRHVLWQTERIDGAIARELALSQKLADSQTLHRWALAEADPRARQEGFAELESFGRLFSRGGWFVAFGSSGNYYFDNAQGDYRGRELIKTLAPDRADDAWFFTTLAGNETFALNVDHDAELNVTNLWINTVIVHQGRKLGVTGTGLELTRFIDEFIHSSEEGVSSLLLNRRGAIVAHEDRKLINMQLHNSRPEDWVTMAVLLDRPEDLTAFHQALEQAVAGGKSPRVLELNMRGRRQVAAVGYLPMLDWVCVSMVDLGSVFGRRQMMVLGGVMGGALLLTVTLLALLLDRLVLVPVGSVARGAARMADGEYQIRLPEGRSDEIGALNASFNHMARTVDEHTRTLEEKVRERTQKLREANRRITEGITYARILQSSLLPSKAELTTTLTHSFVLWQPRDGVGGDFLFLRRDGEHILIGIADCTGHGVAGALTTMTAHAIFSQVVEECGLAHPARLLGACNRRLRVALRGTGEEKGLDNGMELAFCSLDTAAGTVRFAGARLPLYRLTGGKLEIVRGDRHSIGYRDSNPDYPFREHEFSLAAKDLYVLATDGYLDQAGGPRGLSFGNRRFGALLNEIAGLDAATQQTRLEETLISWQGDIPQRDDIAVIGFRPGDTWPQSLQPTAKS